MKLSPTFDKAIKQMMNDAAKASLINLPQRTDLKTSDLYASIETVGTVDGYDLLMNYYWRFVDGGRKAGAKLPPFDAIAGWVKKYNIWDGKGSLNNLINAIRFGIQKNGIKPRPFAISLKEDIEAQAQAILESLLGEILITTIVK